MTKKQWSYKDIPDLSGKVAIVTGGNSGIGYESVAGLAAKNAHVILAARTVEKGERAAQSIRAKHPQAQMTVMILDLAALASVRAFAQNFLAQHSQLDMLINNAGVMAIPFERTADGFERQFGTNHLGHFALTGLLLPALLATPGSRVVSVSSGAHVGGTIDFNDLNRESNYTRFGAYSQSKLANLLFAYELQRQLAKAGAGTISVACHPGYTNTNLQHVAAQSMDSSLVTWLTKLANNFMGQSSAMGALPTLYAAVAGDVNGCDYVGPMGFGGFRGYPGKLKSNKKSYSEDLGHRLWQASEELTGVKYPLAA
jgi:NAD(P)-dependent dehydrogenase (short-subunit alcohol dehydrogenase family)